MRGIITQEIEEGFLIITYHFLREEERKEEERERRGRRRGKWGHFQTFASHFAVECGIQFNCVFSIESPVTFSNFTVPLHIFGAGSFI